IRDGACASPAGLPRWLNVVLAAVLLLVSLPFLALAAIAIALTSGGAILFRQERIGLGGRRFVLLKLRTMRTAGTGLARTAKGEPRVTALGRLLRRVEIDELPQLWKLLRGDMALVGPRPEVPRYVDLESAVWQRVLSVRPGVTDPAALRLLDEEEVLMKGKGDRDLYYRSQLLPLKLREYLSYLDRRSWKSDCAVLLRPGLDLPLLSWPLQRRRPTSGISEGRLDGDADRRRRRVHVLMRILQFGCDVTVLIGAFVAAYLLRFDFHVPQVEIAGAAHQLPLFVPIQLAVLTAAGTHRFIWRYAGLREARTILFASLGSSLCVLGLRLTLPDSLAAWRVPVSVSVIDGMLAFLGILGLRLLRRAVFEYREKRSRSAQAIGLSKSRALLVGAGRAGVLAAREILGQDDMGLQVEGFVDDDPEKLNAEISGFRVLGTTHDLPRLVRELKIEQVVITIARITRPEILRIIAICRQIPVKLRVVPGLYEILQGKVETTRIRIVQVEHLLAREPVHLDQEEIGRFLEGKTVMITGAGG